MLASFRTRRNLIALVVCLLAPAAAWFAADWLGLASGAWVGGFFLIAAGLSAAKTAHKLGAKIAIVEEETFAGTCLTSG